MAILDEIENKIKERGVQKLTENNKNKFWVDRTNSMKGDSSIYNCPKCNSKGFYAYLDENGNYKEKTCTCIRIRSSRNILRNAGLLNFVDSNNSFDSFVVKTTWQERMKSKAIDYVNNGGDKWFFIGGNVGTGKTKLCTTIIAKLLEKKSSSVIYMRWASDFQRYTFDKDREQLSFIKNCQILYIDDFLRNRDISTPERILAMDIIDYRYINNLCTIISSELSYEEIEDIDYALATRIYEKCGSYNLSMKRDKERNVRKNQELI